MTSAHAKPTFWMLTGISAKKAVQLYFEPLNVVGAWRKLGHAEAERLRKAAQELASLEQERVTLERASLDQERAVLAHERAELEGERAKLEQERAALEVPGGDSLALARATEAWAKRLRTELAEQERAMLDRLRTDLERAARLRASLEWTEPDPERIKMERARAELLRVGLEWMVREWFRAARDDPWSLEREGAERFEER